MVKKTPGIALISVAIGLLILGGVTCWRRIPAANPKAVSAPIEVAARPLPATNHADALATPDAPAATLTPAIVPAKRAAPTRAPTALPLWPGEPLVPTAVPVDATAAVKNSGANLTAATAPRFTVSPISPATDSGPDIPKISEAQHRFGVGVPYPPLDAEMANQLGLGWYLSWRVDRLPPPVNQIEFWQMVRLRADGFSPEAQVIRETALANPGSTWFIGNEPDVIWQDNVTPAQYAEWYHHLYPLLKEADPTCRVAIGGVTQPTPLRLHYLDMVLAAYRERYDDGMPVDVWNIHNFILREERNSWGVDIPPGVDADQGILFEVDDHDDLDVFKQQIINFRQWMAARGQRNKPLVVSEYGIAMPVDYGFGFERVRDFLLGTYQFFLTAADANTGYPADDNRLVQRWAWYSLSDDRYPTGNFVNFTSGKMTDLGQAHQQFVSGLP